MDDLTIEPREVAEMMKQKEDFFLLDCREPWEHEVARIGGATLIPMRQIPGGVDRIPQEKNIVVYCHGGTRSLNVASWLQQQGYQARSMNGGIDRWSAEIDPTMARY